MNFRWIPNGITIARMVLALPLFWLLVIGDYHAAFWLALAAGLSDALDGLIAKRCGWRSELGGLLDPIADKLLLCVCFIGLWWTRHLPGWLVAMVFGRDLVIVAGALTWLKWIGPIKPAPSLISKFNTALQLALVAGVLANLAFLPLPEWLLQAMIVATAGLTLVSGIDYVVRYGRRALRAYRY